MSGMNTMSGMSAGATARRGVAALVIAVGVLAADRAVAQNGPRGVRVYLDCQTRGCDFDHFRREIAFATWVRNREDADVHLMVTGRGTGGGGREFTLTLFGRERFAARQDTLNFTTGQTLTDAEVRDELTRMIGLGLVPFAAAGAGYLRELHEGQTLVEDGHLYYVGGGVTHWFFARSRGVVRAAGLRADVRMNLLSGGVFFNDTLRRQGTVFGSVAVVF